MNFFHIAVLYIYIILYNISPLYDYIYAPAIGVCPFYSHQIRDRHSRRGSARRSSFGNEPKPSPPCSRSGFLRDTRTRERTASAAATRCRRRRSASRADAPLHCTHARMTSRGHADVAPWWSDAEVTSCTHARMSSGVGLGLGSRYS